MSVIDLDTPAHERKSKSHRREQHVSLTSKRSNHADISSPSASASSASSSASSKFVAPSPHFRAARDRSVPTLRRERLPQEGADNISTNTKRENMRESSKSKRPSLSRRGSNGSDGWIDARSSRDIEGSSSYASNPSSNFTTGGLDQPTDSLLPFSASKSAPKPFLDDTESPRRKHGGGSKRRLLVDSSFELEVEEQIQSTGTTTGRVHKRTKRLLVPQSDVNDQLNGNDDDEDDVADDSIADNSNDDSGDNLDAIITSDTFGRKQGRTSSQIGSYRSRGPLDMISHTSSPVSDLPLTRKSKQPRGRRQSTSSFVTSPELLSSPPKRPRRAAAVAAESRTRKFVAENDEHLSSSMSSSSSGDYASQLDEGLENYESEDTDTSGVDISDGVDGSYTLNKPVKGRPAVASRSTDMRGSQSVSTIAASRPRRQSRAPRRLGIDPTPKVKSKVTRRRRSDGHFVQAKMSFAHSRRRSRRADDPSSDSSSTSSSSDDEPLGSRMFSPKTGTATMHNRSQRSSDDIPRPISLAAFTSTTSTPSRKQSALRADLDPVAIDSATGSTAPPFAQFGGHTAHVAKLKDMVVLPLLYPRVFDSLGINPPRGVLFWGPPGTGKTLMARELARACSLLGGPGGQQKVSFFMRNGADVLSKWIGEAERQLRLLFEEARKHQPSIIFFDEIDGLAPVRSAKQDHIHSSVVSTLLSLMDGLERRGSVIVIGATNRPDAVDPALRRPGRFDQEFEFTMPEVNARRKILEISARSLSDNLKGTEFEAAFEALLDDVADATEDWSGADLASLVTEASMCFLKRTGAIRRLASDSSMTLGALNLTHEDFNTAAASVTPSFIRWGLNSFSHSQSTCSLFQQVHCRAKDNLSTVDPSMLALFQKTLSHTASASISVSSAADAIAAARLSFSTPSNVACAHTYNGNADTCPATLFGPSVRSLGSGFRNQTFSLLEEARLFCLNSRGGISSSQNNQCILFRDRCPSRIFPVERRVEFGRLLCAEVLRWLPRNQSKPCIVSFDGSEFDVDEQTCSVADTLLNTVPSWLLSRANEPLPILSLAEKLQHVGEHTRDLRRRSCVVVFPSFSEFWNDCPNAERKEVVNMLGESLRNRKDFRVIAYWNECNAELPPDIENLFGSSTLNPDSRSMVFAWDRFEFADVFDALVTTAVGHFFEVDSSTGNSTEDFWTTQPSASSNAALTGEIADCIVSEKEKAEALMVLRNCLRRVMRDLADDRALSIFWKAVNRSRFPTFFVEFPDPLNLEIIGQRINLGHYQTLEQFGADIDTVVRQFSAAREIAPKLLTDERRGFALYLRDQAQTLISSLSQSDGDRQAIETCARMFKNPRQDHSEQEPRSFGELALLFIDAMRVNKNARPFLVPVDREAVPDYYDVIHDPVDLSELRLRALSSITTGQGEIYAASNKAHRPFADIDELKERCRQMFRNARLYNKPSSLAYSCADVLESEFLSVTTLERFFGASSSRLNSRALFKTNGSSKPLLPRKSGAVSIGRRSAVYESEEDGDDDGDNGFSADVSGECLMDSELFTEQTQMNGAPSAHFGQPKTTAAAKRSWVELMSELRDHWSMRQIPDSQITLWDTLLNVRRSLVAFCCLDLRAGGELEPIEDVEQRRERLQRFVEEDVRHN